MKQVHSWIDRFIGHRVYSPTAGSNVGHNWLIADTSSAGTPTYAPAAARGVTLTLDSGQTEVQNVCLYQNNLLHFDIDEIDSIRFQVETGQATLDSNSSIAFGLCSNRHDTIDSLTNHASFRVIGSNAVVVETDDGTTDKDDIATGKSLANSLKEFVISFAEGKRNVKFFIDGQPVATSTTFDMSAATAGLQPYLQIQKASDSNGDAVTLREVEIVYKTLA